MNLADLDLLGAAQVPRDTSTRFEERIARLVRPPGTRSDLLNLGYSLDGVAVFENPNRQYDRPDGMAPSRDARRALDLLRCRTGS